MRSPLLTEEGYGADQEKGRKGLVSLGIHGWLNQHAQKVERERQDQRGHGYRIDPRSPCNGVFSQSALACSTDMGNHEAGQNKEYVNRLRASI